MQTAKLVTDDEEVQEQVLREALKIFLEVDWSIRTTIMATKMQQIITRITGESDPYKSIKSKYNKLALSQYSDYRDLVLSSNDPLLTAIKLSIAGNIIDFGAPNKFDINKTIKDVLENTLTHDNSQLFRKRLSAAKKVLYLSDNAGEIVFDKLLLETILREYSIEKLVFVVKKEPFLNDVMLSDVEEIGLVEDIPEIEIFEVGEDRCEASFLSKFQHYDVIISKGQANYEDLRELSNVFFLFIVKCSNVAEVVGYKEGSSILQYKD